MVGGRLGQMSYLCCNCLQRVPFKAASTRAFLSELQHFNQNNNICLFKKVSFPVWILKRCIVALGF